MPTIERSALISCVVGICGLMCATATAEGNVFSPTHAGWDGTSELRKLISKRSAASVGRAIKLSELKPNDVLWIFAPGPKLPLDSIRAFVADGGTLIVLAEPNGNNELLDRYGIDCQPKENQATWNLRDNPSWPIVVPNQNHSVTTGLRGVVANEGCSLRHADLDPFLVFGGSEAPFAYAGGVEAGRVIMMGDASTLTNGMLRFRGNRLLAENLIEFSARPRHILASPETRWEGYYRDAAELDPASRLEHTLQRVASLQLPHSARAVIALTLLLLLTFPLLLARSRTQTAVEMLKRSPRARVWRMRKGLRLRLELEDSLRRKLNLPRPFLTQGALVAMQKQGIDPITIERTAELLRQLDRLQESGTTRHAPSLSQLEEMVDRAGAILDRIPNR